MRNDPNKVLRTSATTATVNARDYRMVLADATNNAIALTLISPAGYSEWQIKVANIAESGSDVTLSVAGGGSFAYTLIPQAACIVEQDDLGVLRVFGAVAGNDGALISSDGSIDIIESTGVTDITVASGAAAFAGNTLLLAGNVASTETVTIGADVYEVEIVNTDSTDDTDNNDFNNTTNPLAVVDAVVTYSNITFTEGALIRIGTEILRVTDVTGDDVTFQRGASGTTIAAHADAASIFVGDGIAGGSTVAVGLVATLTPAAFSPALRADINSQGTEPFTASAGASNAVVITADTAGVAGNGTVCSETLATAGDVWVSGVTFGGSGAGSLPYSIYQAVLTQASTAAPVATVLQNTLGGSPVWGYTSTGLYTLTLTGAFTEDRTMVTHGDGSGGTDFVSVEAVRTSDNVITVTTKDVDLSGPTADVANGLLAETAFQVIVYE